MKYLLLTLSLAFCFLSCDTPKQNNLANQATAPASTYVSPTVLPNSNAVRTLPPPLSADSIPVEYSVKGIASAPLDFVPMMGQWVATYDQDESVHFLPGKYVSYYKGEKVVEENMTYYRKCPNSCTGEGESDQACFVLASPYGQTCFAIVNHTQQQLQLSLVGAPMEDVLTYVRK